MPNDICLMITH